MHTILNRLERVVVVAPHADDEVLGCGATIARLASLGVEVHVVIVTRGCPPLFSKELVERVAAEAKASHSRLGVHQTHWLDFPAAGLDGVPRSELNQEIGRVLTSIAPDTVFAPFVGDLHFDHQIVFDAVMVWARPRSEAAPPRIWTYETLSETNWSAPGLSPTFAPNLFVDVTDFLEAKIEAFALFASQVHQFPDERSLEALRSLARMRGATVHRAAAEAFMIIRQVE